MEHYRKLCSLFLVIYDIALILSGAATPRGEAAQSKDLQLRVQPNSCSDHSSPNIGLWNHLFAAFLNHLAYATPMESII
jgi:hypothetical protein